MLQRLGIVKSKNKSCDVFMRYIEPSFLSNQISPSWYVKKCGNKYEKSPIIKNNFLNESERALYRL